VSIYDETVSRSHIPASGTGTCYLITAHAGRIAAIVYGGEFSANEEYQATWNVSLGSIHDADNARCAQLMTG
jgi:hypothetical protein